MSQIIDLANITTFKDAIVLKYDSEPETPGNENHPNMEVEQISYEENEKMVKEMFPAKILFTIQEAADLLNVSYEFIRKKILNNRIPSINYGDRKMINLATVITLITYGV